MGKFNGLTAFDLGQTLKDQAYEKFKLTLRNMQILVALPNENWRKELNQIQSPLFLLSPTTVEVTLHKCLLKDDPTMPHIKIKGNLDQININISDYRLIKLAQILDSLVVNDTPDPGSLIRSDSNESMQSALSSLG